MTTQAHHGRFKQPEFDQSESLDAKPSRKPSKRPSVTTSKNAREQSGEDWPAWCDLVDNGCGSLNLTQQHTRVREVVEAIIKEVECDCAIVSLYPELKGKVEYVLQTLLVATKEAGYKEMYQRLKKDDKYAGALSKIVMFFSIYLG